MRFFFLLAITTLLTACGSSSTDELGADATPLLEGRWELAEARRDNVKTGLLDGLYLDFGPDGRLETNMLTNEPQQGSYTLTDDEIVTEGIEIPMTYEVREITGETLDLRTRYRGYLFDFKMRRGGGAPGVES